MPETETTPAVADHTLIRRIGVGSYGEVWLASNVLGTRRAVKIVFRRAFDSERPYEREFSGILKFEPVSRTHPGFVDILQVGRNDPAGYFYYVMELADDATDLPPAAQTARSQEAQSEMSSFSSGETYTPKTLKTELRRKGRLCTAECIEVAIALTNALGHLHQRGLVHRDIKPANIIFVEQRPQLADIGLVTDSASTRTHLGTDGYLPPEGAGSPQSDLYSMGKVLYELSTGLDRKEFPELPPDLASWPDRKQFLALNEIIIRACAADPSQRYASAAEMLTDLERLKQGREPDSWRSTRRRLSLALILAILLGAGLWLSGIFRPSSRAVLVSKMPAAQAAYLRGDARLQRETPADLTAATGYFQQAVNNDPHCAAAHAGMAAAYNLLAAMNQQPPAKLRPKARAAAEAALAIDPKLAAAHAELGGCALEYDWDWPSAERHLRRALELDPMHAAAHAYLATLLTVQGRHVPAVDHARQAVKLAPGSPGKRRLLAAALWHAGQAEESVAEHRRLFDDDRASPLNAWYLMSILESLGRNEEFWTVTQLHTATLHRSPDYVEGYQRAYQQEGPKGFRRLQLQRLGSIMAPGSRAYFELRLGNTNSAIAGLEMALPERWRDLLFLRVSPQWESLWKDPHFLELVTAAGLPDPAVSAIR